MKVQLCGRCIQRVFVSPKDLGDLRAVKGLNGTRVHNIDWEKLRSNYEKPEGWLDFVIGNLRAEVEIKREIGVSVRESGPTIIDGVKRAWYGYNAGIGARVTIFTPVCGVCTEALFEDTLNYWNRIQGTLHFQNGY